MSALRFRVLPRPVEPIKVNKRRINWERTFLTAAFILPGMILFTVFVLMSVPRSAYYSLYDWNGMGPMDDYVKFENYERLYDHEVFQLAVEHSFILTFLALTIQLPLAMALALMVGRGQLRGRKFFRIVLFLPFVFSEVITAIIWEFVLNSREGGTINTVLASIIPDYKTIGWLGHRETVLYVLFGVVTWRYFGFHMILYMAGLQAIPADLEDAARVDGANELRVLQHVTMPLMGRMIRLTIFLSVLGSFQQFVLFWRISEGGPVNGSELIATYLFKYGIQRFNLGYGGAVAVVLFCITLVFSLTYQFLFMRQDYKSQREA
jgi:raffinose/stachyose/melibiose transport system permease protein